MGNHSLDILLGILQRRIECDKDALFQFTQLKKEVRSGVTANDIVAPVLMRFSHGCDQVSAGQRDCADRGRTADRIGATNDTPISKLLEAVRKAILWVGRPVGSHLAHHDERVGEAVLHHRAR